MTKEWYKNVLERVDNGAHVLDVGIGTGTALFRNKSLLQKKNISVTGIDYDKDYVQLCDKNIINEKLSKSVDVRHVSVYEYKGGPYDAAYFSGSLMIMPDPVAALTHVKKMLKPNGKIFITQTFETKKNWLLETTKPLLKFLTTIDFGNVTYEKDFLKSVEKANLKIIENVSLGNSSISSGRNFRLIICSE
jgi:2-polyprenyl-3-methyl-5-hydroxy-6-metoxy-1,4-benzoquinol methylase